MTTMTTRTYTNVALTAIILLLLALVARPYISAPEAHAQLIPERNRQQKEKLASVEPLAINAEATKEIAEANRQIARSIQELAAVHKELAKALAQVAKSGK